MRRAVARGRLVPQSLSTDPRMGQLSLKAALLFPLIWINCDDQGRISGNPHEIKYATCPNIDHILKADIPELLKELDKQELIKVYTTSKTEAIQMLDWWEEQKLQWAYPSKYPPPEGWIDHLRFHPTPTEIITENWPPGALPSRLPSKPASALGSKLQESPLTTAEELGKEIRVLLMALPDFKSYLVEHEMVREALVSLGERKGYLPKQEVTIALGRVDLCWKDEADQLIVAFEIDAYFPKKKSLAKLKSLECPYSFVILRSNPEPFQWEQNILLIGLARARGKKSKIWRGGPLPPPENKIEKEREIEEEEGRLPSKLGSKPPPSPSTHIQIYRNFVECYEQGWGMKTDGKTLARMRDFSQELSTAGCPESYVREAFKEAAAANKYSLSYVRAILFAWLGLERGPPG